MAKASDVGGEDRGGRAGSRHSVGPVVLLLTVPTVGILLAACGHAGSAPAVPLHKGYTAFDSKPVAGTAPAPAPPAVNNLLPVPPIQAPPPSAPPMANAQPRYEPPMPLTAAEPAPRPTAPPPAPLPRASEALLFAVRGVDRADVLYVRAAPGSQSAVVGEIAPETSGIVGMTGQQRIGPSTWREVKYGNVRGWVNARFLVEQGADVGPPLGARRPRPGDR